MVGYRYVVSRRCVRHGRGFLRGVDGGGAGYCFLDRRGAFGLRGGREGRSSRWRRVWIEG